MYLSNKFYWSIAAIVGVLIIGYLLPPIYYIGVVLLVSLLVVTVADGVLLFRHHSVKASRQCAARFSNGDANDISVTVDNMYPFDVHIEMYDEVPVIFNRRDLVFRLSLSSSSSKVIKYQLTPVRRGTYHFGCVRLFVRSSRFGFVVRQEICAAPQDVKVYPSFLMLRKYELLAATNHLSEMGIKRIRRVGQQTEFEQIRDYVRDDDFRSINWKATARKNMLMVNVYEDERSQPVFNVIDKGRVMQQKFRDMTLLDYAINASLVLSYVAVKKEDRAGLITFAEKTDTFIEASRREGQMQMLLESLYSQETTFGETDFSSLCVSVSQRVNRHSLMIVYTNFANMTSMMRQLEYLVLLNKSHRLLVVFFEDSEVERYMDIQPQKMEEYYQHVVADKTVYEKRLIVSTLREHGIYALLTTPDRLSVDVINKYIEMKLRQAF